MLEVNIISNSQKRLNLFSEDIEKSAWLRHNVPWAIDEVPRKK